MRIIGGTLKGRRFDPPPGLGIRPTTDRARESLFNILAHRFTIEDAAVLDAFAGSGAVTLEFLSRGAAHVTALEANRNTAAYFKQLLAEWGLANCRVMNTTAEKYLAETTDAYDYIFLDPPYALPQKFSLIDTILSRQLLRPDGQAVLEHPAHEQYDQHTGFTERRDYGLAAFSFFAQP